MSVSATVDLEYNTVYWQSRTLESLPIAIAQDSAGSVQMRANNRVITKWNHLLIYFRISTTGNSAR